MKKEEVNEKKKPTTKKTPTGGNKTTKKQETSSTVNKSTTKKENVKKVTPKKESEKKETTKKESLKKKTGETALSKEEVVEDVMEQEEFEEKEELESVTIKSTKNKQSSKKSDAILILGLVVVVILGCLLMKGEKEKASYELPLTLSGDNGLQELSYQEYQDKIDAGESFVVIIERAACSHCVNFMPVAEEFAKDHVPMYYVDTDTFSEDDWNEFEKSNTFFKKKSGNWGTPTTIVLAGKEAVDYIEGETTADKLEELYNQYFDINEE